MVTYLINATITWLVLFLVYRLILEKEKHFRINRFYLLVSIVLGLVLPAISFISFAELSEIPTITSGLNQAYQAQLLIISEYSDVSQRSNSSPTESAGISLTFLLQLFYFIGFSIALFRIEASNGLFSSSGSTVMISILMPKFY